MIIAVSQQQLIGRQRHGRNTCQSLFLVPREPQPIVEVPLPTPLADTLQSFNVLLLHELSTDIGLGNEGKRFLQFGLGALERTLQWRLIRAAGQPTPVIELGIAPEHFEAHAYFMDAVVEGFQLGRLVHHVFGAGDLAAVVQPGSDMELIALGITQGEVGIRAAVGLHGFVQQHLGQLRHPLAMTSRVGALGVDGIGQQLDHGIEQALLSLDQLTCFDGHGRGAGQLLDKASKWLPHPFACPISFQLQHQNAEQRLTSVVEHDRQAAPAQFKGMADDCRQVPVIVRLNLELRWIGLATAASGQAQLRRLRIEQVDRSGVHASGIDQVRQHAFEHAFELALTAERE